MHIQAQFKETREEILHEQIRQYPLACFVVHSDALIVNHFPMFLGDGGEHGVLKGHVPRSSELWEALGSGVQALAVFQGPQAYVSPSWYPSKHEHGKAVPTWNYTVVHAQGLATAVQDPEWLLQHLTELTNQQEARQTLPWQVSDAPPDFTQNMIAQIVGIELPIASLVGKWKVSQNRPHADQLGVAAGLRNRGSSHDIALEQLILSELAADTSDG